MHNPHPGLPEMDYVKPVSLEEASRFLAAHAGEARPFLGATDCIVRLRDGAWKAKYLVDVKGLDGTRALDFDPQKGLTIGAAVHDEPGVRAPRSTKGLPHAGGSLPLGSQLPAALARDDCRQYLQCLAGGGHDRRGDAL